MFLSFCFAFVNCMCKLSARYKLPIIRDFFTCISELKYTNEKIQEKLLEVVANY